MVNVDDQDAFEADVVEVVLNVVVVPLVCDDDIVELDVEIVVTVVVVVVVVDVVLLCLLLLYDVVMELVCQDDDVDVYLVVDDVVYFCSVVDVLLEVHSDVVVHDDQLDVDDVLILILDAILISDAAVVIVLYDVAAGHDGLCISLLDGLLSLYVVCVYVADVSAIAVVDVETAFVVASLVGMALML